MENVRAVLARLLVMTFEIFMFQVTSNTRVLCTVPRARNFQLQGLIRT